MPITNQRAADARCGVRRSDVILLILCRARSTCVHAALLTALLPSSPLPLLLPLFTRRNFGERSDSYPRSRDEGFGAGGWFQVARNQGSVLEDVASDRDRHPNAVPLPLTPPPIMTRPRWSAAPRTRVEYRNERIWFDLNGEQGRGLLRLF